MTENPSRSHRSKSQLVKSQSVRSQRVKSTTRTRAAKTMEPEASRPFAPGYGIVGSKDGKGLLPWKWVAKKMNGCRTFWLATIYAGKNRPHVMPICGVWLEDAFFFSTGSKSRKAKNLAVNSACTISNDDALAAVIAEGEATIVKSSALLERVAKSYKKKYKIDPRSMEEPIFSLRPTQVFGFIEKSFPKTATRWTL